MKILNWNIRGLGLPEKRRYLKEFVFKEHFDILCIQETKKTDFSQHFLDSISPKFSAWHFLPSVGAAGGILMGINTNCCQLINWTIGSYSLTAYIQNKKDKVIWACTLSMVPLSSILSLAFGLNCLTLAQAGLGRGLLGGILMQSDLVGKKKGCLLTSGTLQLLICGLIIML
jgi:hypothetical protein